MAITVAQDDNFINVTFDGVTDWDISSNSQLNQDLANGIRVSSIQMIPTATNDTLVIRKGSATGVIIAKWVAADVYDSRILYFKSHRLQDLYIKGSEGSSGVMMIIET